MKNTNLETPPNLIIMALNRFLPSVYLTTEWLDMCATKKNRKFAKYWNKKENMFKQNLGDYNGFCNPPFDNIAECVKFCYDQHRIFKKNVMMLLPCYTDSKWWTEYIGDQMQYVDDFFFLDKRLGFFKDGKEIKSNKYYMPCVFILWRKK